MIALRICITLSLILGTSYCIETESHNEADLTIDCKGRSLDTLPPYPDFTTVSSVNITQCLSSPSYAEALRKLNVSVEGLKELALDNVGDWVKMEGRQLKGLTLRELMICNHNDRQIVRLPDDFVDYLVGTLKVLKVQRVKLPVLPAEIKLKSASVIRGYTLQDWGGCKELKKLYIKHWVLSEIPSYENGWLPTCTKLEELTVVHANEQTVRHTLKGARALRHLSIHQCALLYITMFMFADAEHLQELVFTHHSIYGIDLTAFQHQTRLLSLDMSYNELVDPYELAQVYRPLVSLTRLSLDHNPLKNFCAYWNETSLPIEKLYLRSTQLPGLCFGKWTNLTFLDLSDNRITNLDISELPVVDRRLVVDLRRNPITELPISQQDYEVMMDRFNQSSPVILKMDLTLDCDCQHAFFVKALLSLPSLTVTGVKCAKGEDIHSIPLTRLECDKFACSDCVCRRYWSDNMTVAYCNQKLRDLLPLQSVGSLRKLSLRGNVVDNLPETRYPDSLTYIDLRDNRLASISEKAATALFSVKNRRVRLAGNPLVCDCDTASSVSALQKYSQQIEDYESLRCVNDGSHLYEVDVIEICIADWDQIWPIIVIVAVVATIIFVMATLYWKYEQQIKMFLYTRGLCLYFLHEEDLDSNRKFDAFIAFSHEDDDFVTDHLLPGLQEYKLCIHYRNWIAGDWIPHQIAKSIEQSKRTILVLSKKFLRSPWGMLEFRMSHAAMLQEGRARLIAIVLDDAPSQKRLDAELRGYLAANTYIRWGDPWFFDKLRYALPHKDSYYGGAKNSYYKDNMAYVDEMITEFSFKSERKFEIE